MAGPGDGGVPDLVALLQDEIRARGPIPFARFMEAALYEPGLGYYARDASRIGTGGDYFTAASTGPLFGACVARQAVELDRLLGEPVPFHYVEFAAGRGHLTRDVLDALDREAPGARGRIRAVMVDRSAAMRDEARARVPEAEVVAEAPRIDGAGVAVAVELLDALPVHRVRRAGGDLRELRVGIDRSGAFVEVEGEPTPEVSELARRYGAAPADGDEGEVCPALDAELERVAGALRRGFVVLVDYGAPASELYDRGRRRGTLLAYRRHATNEDYLARVGEQDLTAHVNWTQVEDRARQLGLSVLGRTTQDRFLIANGLLAVFDESDPAEWGRPERVRARLQAKQLMHPGGMGRAFQVTILAKGLDAVPTLAGLADPFR